MIPVAAVAFDLDGTLYPNYRLNLRLLPFLAHNWRLLAAFGKARNQIRREQEEKSSYQPDFYGYQAELTAQRLNEPSEQVREKIEKLIYRSLEPHFLSIKLFSHVRPLLAELQAVPLKLGLLSDFPPETKLKNLGLADCWNAMICSERTGALKPAVRPFIELANALGCPPEQILFVGNSYRYDVLGARKAGMKTALIARRFAVNTTQPRADFTFHNYRQLRNIMLE